MAQVAQFSGSNPRDLIAERDAVSGREHLPVSAHHAFALYADGVTRTQDVALAGLSPE